MKTDETNCTPPLINCLKMKIRLKTKAKLKNNKAKKTKTTENTFFHSPV